MTRQNGSNGDHGETVQINTEERTNGANGGEPMGSPLWVIAYRDGPALCAEGRRPTCTESRTPHALKKLDAVSFCVDPRCLCASVWEISVTPQPPSLPRRSEPSP